MEPSLPLSHMLLIPGHAHHLLIKNTQQSVTANRKATPLHLLRHVLLMPWHGPLSSLYLISATVLPAMERELYTSMELCLLADKQSFDPIAVVIVKPARWSAFKMLCFNHSL